MKLKKIIPGFILVFACSVCFQTAACTNFCMDTPQGPLFGCNLDLFIPGDGLVFINQRRISKAGFEPGTTGKTARWTSVFGSVTFNLVGKEWAFGGMNEAGLVLGAMELATGKFPDPDERPPLPIGLWAQYMLDTCKNTGEVLDGCRKIRIQDPAVPIHFLIADAAGKCAVIEWVNGRQLVYSGKSLPEKALSNSIYSEALKIYNRGGPKWWQSDRGDTNKRFADAAKRNHAFKSDGNRNHDIRYTFETLTHIVTAPHTKWNIVYDIPKRMVLFRSAASPSLKYLSFSDLDFSCTGPLLMLDINAQVEGDIKNAFTPYDSRVNRGVFKTFSERYQLDLTEDDITHIMQHIESFSCTP